MAALGKVRAGEIAAGDAVDAALAALPGAPTTLRPVINATGVLLHTNLGRAPLSAAAVEAIEAAAGTTDVELDLATGRRGPRGAAARSPRWPPRCPTPRPCTWSTTARPRSCWPRPRWPRAGRSWSAAASWSRSATGSGSRTCSSRPARGCARSARPTGSRSATTRAAVGPDTAFVLKVHPSNFVVTGFTVVGRRPPSCRRSACRSWPTSAPGCSRPTRCCRTSRTPRRALRAGAALVTASGDKLLGGPQAGLLLGPAPTWSSGCAGTRSPGRCGWTSSRWPRWRRRCAGRPTPTGRRLDADPARCGPGPSAGRPRWPRRRRRRVPSTARPPSAAAARPGVTLPSRGRRAARGLAAPLRAGEPAVLGRVERGRLLLDLRARRAGPTTRRCAAPCSRAGRDGCADARRRDRRARRPRQVHAGPGADRDGARPLRGGAAPRHDHRPRLRLDDRCPAARSSRSSTCPGTSGSCRRCSPGSGPVPAVLLVVAADEGWMPQSAEHLAALDALGVRHGLLAVTRCDLADPAPALADVRARLAPDLAARRCRPSRSARRTGAGLDDLRAALGRLVAALPAPDAGAPVRLWVDRAFTIRGSGTVVTGTLAAGTLRVGDELTARRRRRPRRVRVRGLQSLGAACRLGRGRGPGRGEPARASSARTWRAATSSRHRGRCDADGRASTSGSRPADDARRAAAGRAAPRVGGGRRSGSGRWTGRRAPVLARLTLDRPCRWRAGDARCCATRGAHRDRRPGVRILDADPAAADPARGRARDRAAVLAELWTGAPDGAALLARAGALRAAALRPMGCRRAGRTPSRPGTGCSTREPPRAGARRWRSSSRRRRPAGGTGRAGRGGAEGAGACRTTLVVVGLAAAAARRPGRPRCRDAVPDGGPAAPVGAAVEAVPRTWPLPRSWRRKRTGWPSSAWAAGSSPPPSGRARCCGSPRASTCSPGADERRGRGARRPAAAVHALAGAAGPGQHPARRRPLLELLDRRPDPPPPRRPPHRHPPLTHQALRRPAAGRGRRAAAGMISGRRATTAG